MNVAAMTDQVGANDRDRALRERAQRVIPGGMWGHMNAARLPPEYPQYFAKAEGARIWDVNGRDYVDFMCAWGPMVLGYRDPDVEAAMRAQSALGDSLNGPSERLVELAELLNTTIPHCDWSLLAKNGTDATTICLTVARAGTGKRKVLIARKAYHGAAPWCTPYPAGTLPEDRAHQIFGVRPDLSAFSKAIANGYALAAVTGTDRFREAATKIFTTGSFWFQAIPMAAALATLDKLHALDGPALMERAGLRFREGIQAQAQSRGIKIRQSGPPQMPLILFEDDPEVIKGKFFCVEALKRGVYLHPVHTMFLSCAHTDAEIDRALEATDGAFAAVAAKFG
jgi:glutamate-1-semialdehyde aminotransferase